MGSTMPRPSGVTEILTEYVRLRQNGRSQQEAIGYLRPILERLNSDARQQLAALIRSWEAREGSKYQPAQKSAAFYEEALADVLATNDDPSWLPPDSQPASTPLAGGPVHPSVEESRHATVPIEPQEVFYCPSCGKANQPGDAYCFSCGAVLNVVSTQTRNLEPADAELVQVGQTHFTPTTTLLLFVRGEQRPMAIQMAGKPELVLGRRVPDSSANPDIDLAPYKAGDYGVSRLHAKLRFQDNTLTITDLDSVNHTYINGQRLHAHEVRVLRDGDEIRLARLSMQVMFQHQVRKLK
jgi:hypothetical protein